MGDVGSLVRLLDTDFWFLLMGDVVTVSPEAISPVNPTLPSQLVVLFSALGSILSIIFQNGNVDREIVVKQPELYQ